MQLVSAIALVVLAACQARSTPTPRPVPPPNPGPDVDALCLEQARRGTLIESMPHEVSGFEVTPTTNGVYMRRPGRAVTVQEGDALWHSFGTDQFGRGAYGRAGPARCKDVGEHSCISVDAWICQRGLAVIAEGALAAAAIANAPDAELGVQVLIYESYRPACNKNASCGPTPHYSTKHASYDPARGRRRVGDRSVGRCTVDGDCVGHDSNWCKAWYLRGGSETADYVENFEPTFCGCVENVCSWFRQ